MGNFLEIRMGVRIELIAEELLNIFPSIPLQNYREVS
jgi:hypothetical protein